ncbi:MAG: hypothetical protein WKF75_20955 [Singulisphaera sp.]
MGGGDAPEGASATLPRPRVSPRGRAYTAEEIDFFWQAARQVPFKLKDRLREKLEGSAARTSSSGRPTPLKAGRRPVFTATGRLRERDVQQQPQLHLPAPRPTGRSGPVAGLGVGHKLVDFVHDQLVVESPADDRVPAQGVAEIEELMKRGAHDRAGDGRQGRDGRHPLAEQEGPGPPTIPRRSRRRRPRAGSDMKSAP